MWVQLSEAAEALGRCPGVDYLRPAVLGEGGLARGVSCSACAADSGELVVVQLRLQLLSLQLVRRVQTVLQLQEVTQLVNVQASGTSEPD